MENKKIKILLAEDDQNLGFLLKEYLAARGYYADLCKDGVEGYKLFMKQPYDICILDVMMPFKDGFKLASEIRVVNSEIPVIFLTAKSLKEDVIEGLRLGADDYITKPFSMEELLLRIEAILRRTGKQQAESTHNEFSIGKYHFNANNQTLTFQDTSVKLTTKESDLLKLLCNNVNKVLDRNTALQIIWKEDTYFNARSMDVYITKLRKMLKDDPSIQIINVHGKGFKLIIGE